MCISRWKVCGKFAEAQKAANAAREAEKARKVRMAGQPTELERDVDTLKDGLLQQSQIISDAEKRIGSIVKRMEKLEKRVKDMEWDNWKSNSASCNSGKIGIITVSTVI